MKQAIIYFLQFLALQVIGGFVVQAAWQYLSGSADTTTARLITMSVVVSVLTLAIFLLSRWAEVSPRWLRTRPWSVLCWSAVAALGAIMPYEWLEERLPELPNWFENDFSMILGSPWGYLAIGLLAPLSEEVVFRGAILRALLGWAGRSNATAEVPPRQAWLMIALSALLFSVAHMNPAQMLHAFVIGLLLGWMYWRTGSILPGLAFHWANNSVAYVLYGLYPDPSLRLIDLFGGSQQHMLLAVLFSLLILLPALYQLHLWMKRA